LWFSAVSPSGKRSGAGLFGKGSLKEGVKATTVGDKVKRKVQVVEVILLTQKL